MNSKGFDVSWLEQLKAKNDIVTVLSRYLNLQQKGRNYWACCPFHNEKTPSFCIYPMEQYYHCYGCKEHGNVITFIMKKESCDYLTAIEILAKNANMEVPSSSMDDDIYKRKKQKETMLKVLDCAAKHYEKNLYLKTSTMAQSYIKKRQLTKKELDKFHIGYSVDWTEIIDYLKSQHFSYEDMELAGIINKKNDRYYDTMGERLIFPIYNIFDECIGFSARSLVPTTHAKYKNSANNLVFDKSKNLFGINFLRDLKKQNKLNYIILVEGQMDVISLHKYGFENCVACLGTALTSYHVNMLKYISENIIISLDGDFAGQKATMSSIDTLVNGGMNVKAIKIPNNQDPDEFLKEHGKEEYQKLLDNALDWVEFKIRNKLDKYDITKPDEKAKFVKDSIEIVNKLNTNGEKQVYLDIINNITNISTEILSKDLIDEPPTNIQIQTQVQNSEDAELKAIKFILASLLYKKEYANFNFDLKKCLKNSSFVKIYEIMQQYNQKKENLMISTLFDVFEIENEPNIQDIIDYDFSLISNPEIYYNECVWKIRENYLKNQIKDLTEQYKNEINNDIKLQIAKNITETQRKLRNKILED